MGTMYGAPRITQCLFFLYEHNARNLIALCILNSQFTSTGAAETVAGVGACATFMAVCLLAAGFLLLVAS